ncbi:MAG: sugar phosphate nucleotidyltransferase [Chitinophagales bacterium]|jgi:glucose-1-phosphate thymidylyltransferase|nr:sugar phosphate nucleotidyltransferase [Chitinophagales bacterium]
MKLIIPMAGWGTRLRPYTLTTPKPMVKIAGKSIVERLVENVQDNTQKAITEISFIIRKDFGLEIEAQLHDIAERHQVISHIFYQEEALGTAHAVFCAHTQLQGPVIIGFADTMYDSDYTLDQTADVLIWAKKIPNPEQFGVIVTDDSGRITSFIEKPKDFVSDLAIIGVYYFQNGEKLKEEIQYLFDHEIKDKNEYQLTTVLDNLHKQGKVMRPVLVEEWLDCGNTSAMLESTQKILQARKFVSISPKLHNALVIEPCHFEAGVTLQNCIVGPNVSISENATISDSVLSDTIVMKDTLISHKVLKNSIIGERSSIKGSSESLYLGHFTKLDA